MKRIRQCRHRGDGLRHARHSTDCPHGPREILEDGRWGSLVPVANVDGLAEAGRITRQYEQAMLSALPQRQESSRQP